MSTPFDEVVEEIRARGFHNHRLQEHSGTVSRGILRDLSAMCEPFRRDFAGGRIHEWLDFPSPGGRARKLDLVVAEPGSQAGVPDLARLRLCVENKSVVTAHRNRTNRYDDLSDVLGVLHHKKPDAILVATVLVGLADRVLNVSDRVRPFVTPAGLRRTRLAAPCPAATRHCGASFRMLSAATVRRTRSAPLRSSANCRLVRREGPTWPHTTTSFLCLSSSTMCPRPGSYAITPSASMSTPIPRDARADLQGVHRQVALVEDLVRARFRSQGRHERPRRGLCRYPSALSCRNPTSIRS